MDVLIGSEKFGEEFARDLTVKAVTLESSTVGVVLSVRWGLLLGPAALVPLWCQYSDRACCAVRDEPRCDAGN